MASLGILVLVVGLSFTTSGQAQASESDWEAEFFETLERAAAEHNAQTGSDEAEIYETWLVGDSRVNLYIRGGAVDRGVLVSDRRPIACNRRPADASRRSDPSGTNDEGRRRRDRRC